MKNFTTLNQYANLQKLLLYSLFAILPINAQAQQVELDWVKQLQGSGLDWGSAITVDETGSIYTTGHFYESIDLNPGTGNSNHTAVGGQDIFVSKLDANGDFVWGKTFGSSGGNDMGTAITVDDSGNVYIAGYFQDTVDFDPGTGVTTLAAVATGFYADLFICKLDASGNFQWAKQFNTNSLSFGYPLDIKTDHLGNICITSCFEGTTDFDPGPGVENRTTHTGQAWETDIFLLKLTASGDYIRVRTFGGNSYDVGCALALDTLGNTYLTGSFSDSADFDPSGGAFHLFSQGMSDAFILKLNEEGLLVWAKSVGGSEIDQGVSISADLSGDLVITGFYNDTVDFDPDTGITNLITQGYGDNTFILKLDNAGGLEWVQGVGGNNNRCTPDNAAMDRKGNIYLCGHFEDTVDFDPGTSVYNQSSAGGMDAFILKLNRNGDFDWAKRIGADWSDWANAIAVDHSGNVFTTGAFNATVDFDPGSGVYNLTTYGTTAPGTPSPEDAFIHKMICTDTTSSSLNVSACKAYNLNGITYTTSGTYTQVFPNSSGCDSTLALNLVIDSIDITVNQNGTTLTANMIGATYQWIDCTDSLTPITGATNQTFPATEDGRYAVIITVNGCSDTSDCYAVEGTAIKNLKFDRQLKVYPNPANTRVSITSVSELRIEAIRIVNILGAEVLSKAGNQQTQENLEISQLSNGIYMLHIQTDKGTAIRKLEIIR